MTLSMLGTDEELVGGARAGEDRAFEELYARYSRRIRAYVMRLTSDHHRADDITQEVFISALRRLRETDQAIAFRPWIYEIARNACIDEYRRRSRSQEVAVEPEEEGTWNGAPVLASVPSPEVAIESKQRLDDLCGAFRGLSERHHKIIVLREFEGLSYSQIGDRLGMSKMVVESTLFRARRRLTEEYEDLSSGRRCQYVLRLISAEADGPVRTLGLRDRRALCRHLEHCDSCRRVARAAGYEDKARMGVAGKVAAFLPAPILRWLGRASHRTAALARGAHQALLPSASSVGAYAGPLSSLGPSGRAAATAATLLVAAVGGGIATDAGGSTAPARARDAISAPAGQPRGAGSPAGATSAREVVLLKRKGYYTGAAVAADQAVQGGLAPSAPEAGSASVAAPSRVSAPPSTTGQGGTGGGPGDRLPVSGSGGSGGSSYAGGSGASGVNPVADPLMLPKVGAPESGPVVPGGGAGLVGTGAGLAGTESGIAGGGSGTTSDPTALPALPTGSAGSSAGSSFGSVASAVSRLSASAEVGAAAQAGRSH